MHFRRGILIAAIGAAAVGLLWQLPQWQAAPWRAFLTPKDLLLVENALRQTVVLVIGAGLAVAALAILWRRVAAAERAMQVSLTAAQETQRSERFGRAVAQLADDRLAVRIGALYVLEQIAAGSASQHWPIMEVLCAYLREHAGWVAERPRPERLPIDVQAVLTILGRRTRTHERKEELDLRGTDLRGALLDGVHLERAILVGAHLEDASLQEAHLETADLRGAFLHQADMVDANLKGANLSEAHLELAYLVEAHLEGANLGGAFMAGAYLSGAHLEGADLGGAHLDGAYFYKAHLEGASLYAARAISTMGTGSDDRARINRTAPEDVPRSTAPVSATKAPVSLRSRKRRTS
jgi:Pentapeptide repeats (8 copies)